jgi:uncharacterized protein YjbI with pentapeptide repeats
MKITFAALCAFALSIYSPQPVAASVPRVCTGCNFAGSQLSGMDFSNVVYVGANFARADLERANFAGAKLIGANFRDADLRGANFENANCTGCNLKGAKLDGVRFTGARMTGANLDGFDGAVDNGELRALLEGCVGCNLNSAQLARRDLSALRLVGISFAQADLRNTNFDGATMCWRNSDEKVQCDDMRAAQVGGASFRGVKICDSDEMGSACQAVDGQTLREYSGSTLSGATLPQ